MTSSAAGDENGIVVHNVSDQLYTGLAQLGSLSVADSSGDSRLVVQAVANLCIDTIADLCIIYKRVAGPLPAAFASRTPEAHAELATASHDDLFVERARACGIQDLHEAPLNIGGRLIGTVILGTIARDAIDGKLMTLVSNMLSMTIEQGRELAHHYHVSTRLQKALLPSRLLQVEGMAFDAAYRPASAEADVGGDWYDVFEVGNGTIGISVGDVTGHGLEAAVTMSEIRRGIRAALSSSTSPAAVINQLDAIISSEKSAMATAIVGIYDPRSSQMTYAAAGHPAPILLTGSGRARILPAGGTILGVSASPSSTEYTVTLTRGTSCIFYTDGLLEYSRDVIAGEQELLDAIERLADRRDLTADSLHREVFREIENNDDCATLALHHVDFSNPCALSLTYTAMPIFAAVAREAVRNFSERQGIIQADYEISAAVGEAIANAIEHGEHGRDETFSVNAVAEPDRLIVQVESRGHWRVFNPRDERGRGIPIMRACASAFEIASTHESTCITLTFERERPR